LDNQLPILKKKNTKEKNMEHKPIKDETDAAALAQKVVVEGRMHRCF
jgi:hypothetical protein